MIRLIDFSDYLQEYSRTYGGASCRKYDIIHENENWFLKFPGNIKNQVNDLSYSNSSVSEYIGSHIYELLGIDTHETQLGVYKGKCVVACKDFIQRGEFPVTGFGEFKTTFVPAFLDSQGNETNGNGTDLQEILQTLDEHPLLARLEGMKERFWDMFVIDAFIGNNDRNNGNWGLIKNIDGEYRISPVYDNGSCLLPKTSEDKMKKMLESPDMFENVMYKGYSCIFELNGHRINPLKYMESAENLDCIGAMERIIPRINMKQIKNMIYEIPNKFRGVDIINDTTKEMYSRLLSGRYNEILVPALQKSISKEINHDPMKEVMHRTAARTPHRSSEPTRER